ncbi:WcaI family glycosyltransferase [Cellulophaga baltica]|uniref:WcaI family glycosyltransferase n=1 Tax=Cellulophaga TaxID=104264 RepID=UPI001C068884|nr:MULTISPECIES: WcaI family glycosyltransferase [Cellulophaga]MBU2995644.1 WcaI family glycosyltransferase [Cellulophaga baltica]MDO6767038.1 WcaI family glycosyltransferase [Cellulophaga sp. 1_MG-2023]
MRTEKKRILFIGYNFSPELTGIGKYSGEMMQWMAKEGFDCTVLTAYPYYPQWKVQEPYRKNRFWYKKETQQFESGGKLTVVRCPMYVPTNPTGLKRMILDTTFSSTASLALIPKLFQQKYDWVISIAPSFQFGLLGVFYKKLKGAKHLHHIQDLQIEAAQDLGLIKSPALLKILYGTEKFIFKHTDVVSSISDGMMERIERKAKKPILFFPNWTNTKSFFPIENNTELKEQFGFKESDYVVLYSGAIGEKQGLEAILNAAEALKEVTAIQFIICGTGPYKEKLITMAKEMKLTNVKFMALQPMEKFNAFLNMADLHLVIQKEKASDLVMPSKLTTILAVGGLALVTANSNSSIYKLMQNYNMGIMVAAENQLALNKGIKEAFENKNASKMKANARGYASQYLAMDNIMTSFSKQL